MEDVLKRLTDILIAFVAMVVLAPLLGFIWVAVRITSPGPAIFRQKRLGRHGVTFRICKFRTMRNGAPDLRNADGSAFTGQSDPRVTPLGAWLRATSLDELPQLWNVLAGEMSIVGPRPDQSDQLRYYSTADRVKLAMRPGITGLAQISGRNSISWEHRRQLDAHYVANWSLWRDFEILFKTFPYVFLRRGIHEGGSNGSRTATDSNR
ncbi:MAG: sugar transferase [Acidobacteria bacterium]|nr:sugar transferase [Acidobacteriota bacterium]